MAFGHVARHRGSFVGGGGRGWDLSRRSEKGQSDALAANPGWSQLCRGDSQLDKTTRGEKKRVWRKVMAGLVD